MRGGGREWWLIAALDSAFVPVERSAQAERESEGTTSTATHHFRVLREAGVIQRRQEETARLSSLRLEDLDERFPGLLDAILESAPAHERPRAPRGALTTARSRTAPSS